MKLPVLVERYIAYKRSLGKKFDTYARALRLFVRTIGKSNHRRISPDKVLAFLNGSGPLTQYWHHKASALRGLQRFARERGFPFHCPLPAFEPKKPERMKPYIYAPEEIRRILAAVAHMRMKLAYELEPFTLHAVLLTLYGAALRIGEAISLTVADVDLDQRILTIRDTKFFKTRLVPIGPKLAEVLTAYAVKRKPWAKSSSTTEPFFVGRRSGRRLSHPTVECWFRRICNQAGVRREADARYQPRLHDLRHSAAVHRLLAWYRRGADLSTRLHHLSVYLGHRHLQDTQVYLTLTPELLAAANRRFHRYAFSEDSHV
jgi:integrase/recombinase XerD